MPVRQLMVRHVALASISSAGTERMSGMCRRRGRPRLATGQIILHIGRIHLEVPRNTDCPSKTLSPRKGVIRLAALS